MGTKKLEFNTTDEKMAFLFKVLHNVKLVTIKDNFKDILVSKNPNEYTEKDDVFFNKYKGKYTHVYKYCNCDTDDLDWFILEDNNTPITEDCWIKGEL